ncbi:hypothetical protein SLA2020_403720 [Shorea laevis]
MMTSNQPLLWVDCLRKKYLKNGISFLNASPNPLASWLWKGLLKNREVVSKGACISILMASTLMFGALPGCLRNQL